MAVKLRGQIKKVSTAQKFDDQANPRVVLTLTIEVDGAEESDVEHLVGYQRADGVRIEVDEVQGRLKGTK